MKKRLLKLRIAAFLMSIHMLLSLSFSMSVMAVTDIDGSIQKSDGISENYTIEQDAVVDVTELDLSTVPDVVGEEKAKQSGHLLRLYSEEDNLSSVVFANSDGTRTAYYFDHPVKYVDEDGKVKDISLKIKQDDKLNGAYASSDNRIQTVFSAKITDGILLSDTDVSLKLVPELNVIQDGFVPITPVAPETATMSVGSDVSIAPTKISPVAELVDDKTVSYVLDSKTSYEYSLTYSGFKEDIVVSEYTGQTEYSFTLYTNGLSLAADNAGDYYLYDADGNIKANVGNIIIFTADEKNNTFGTLTAQTVEENEEYILTIHVDADYLADERTKYPIRIDPTIEISYNNYGAGAIHDVTINSAETMSGSSGSISAGKYGDDQSISRILMKFPGVDFASIGTITSATVYIRDLMCQHEYLTLDCYIFVGSTWSETSTVTWSGVGAGSTGAFLDSNEISYFEGAELSEAHYYGYDITAAVQGWKNGTQHRDKGIIFKAASDHESNTVHNYKTFASYNRANYKPYFVISYENMSATPSIAIYDTVIDILANGNSRAIHYNCYPSDAVVTWRSSANRCVSVSSDGIITSGDVGSAIITATITYNGITYSEGVLVHSYLEDGVYKITTSMLDALDVADRYDLDNTEPTIDTIQNVVSQYWRIHHIKNDGYTIRPMHNPTMLLGANDYYEPTLENHPTYSDSEDLLCSTYVWTILEYEGKYEISNLGLSDYQILCPDENLSSVYMESSASSDEPITWTLEMIEYSPRILLYNITDAGTLLYTSLNSNTSLVKYIAKYEEITLSQLGLKFVYSAEDDIGQEFEYSIENNSSELISIDANGKIVGLKGGSAVVRVSRGNVTFTFNVCVSKIANGVYYIQI